MNKRLAFLNSNDGSGLLALGSSDSIRLNKFVPELFQNFLDLHAGEYIFFTLSYDCKNSFEELNSTNPDRIGFPDAIAWVPEVVVRIKDHEPESNDPEIKDLIRKLLQPKASTKVPKLSPSITKEYYLTKVTEIKKHLQRGDCYELNFCQEFYAEHVSIEHPENLYSFINKRSQAPFSAYLWIDEFSVFCASPERFIKKVGTHLLSQPIKGTIQRGASAEEDLRLKEELKNDPKERSENIMIVDLVRNDLSRIAKKASVRVDELCAIYTFKNVHQMISSISCELKSDCKLTDILQALFPMGSMTGAPKIRAMQLIEEYENFKRGLYSGSIGYIDPKGDFDMNVVIRTLIWNKTREVVSCPVGSAITISSDPEKEYDECLTKIRFLTDAK